MLGIILDVVLYMTMPLKNKKVYVVEKLLGSYWLTPVLGKRTCIQPPRQNVGQRKKHKEITCKTHQKSRISTRHIAQKLRKTLRYLPQLFNQQSVKWFVHSERFSKGEHNCIFYRLQLYRVSSTVSKIAKYRLCALLSRWNWWNWVLDT